MKRLEIRDRLEIRIEADTELDLADMEAFDPMVNGVPASRDDLINRAVQVYAVMQRMRRNGEQLYYAHEDLVSSRQVEFTAFDWD